MVGMKLVSNPKTQHSIFSSGFNWLYSGCMSKESKNKSGMEYQNLIYATFREALLDTVLSVSNSYSAKFVMWHCTREKMFVVEISDMDITNHRSKNICLALKREQLNYANKDNM